MLDETDYKNLAKQPMKLYNFVKTINITKRLDEHEIGNPCKDKNGCIDAIFTRDNRLKILVNEEFEAWIKSQI